MTGKFLAISAKEWDVAENVGWPYISGRKSDWVDFDFEESSIDLGISTEPRIVVDGIAYSPYAQYFIKEGGSTTRLLVGREIVYKKPYPTWSSRLTVDAKPNEDRREGPKNTESADKETDNS